MTSNPKVCGTTWPGVISTQSNTVPKAWYPPVLDGEPEEQRKKQSEYTVKTTPILTPTREEQTQEWLTQEALPDMISAFWITQVIRGHPCLPPNTPKWLRPSTKSHTINHKNHTAVALLRSNGHLPGLHRTLELLLVETAPRHAAPECTWGALLCKTLVLSTHPVQVCPETERSAFVSKNFLMHFDVTRIFSCLREYKQAI